QKQRCQQACQHEPYEEACQKSHKKGHSVPPDSFVIIVNGRRGYYTFFGAIWRKNSKIGRQKRKMLP
ncbi:MAG: hypothetical protein IJD10_01020, partial [Clostridia bacterium]|nr:hypothetical protein [Clostridia bacterium]